MAKNSLELLDAVRSDIDKFMTATLEYDEFNRLAARALDEFVSNAYSEFEEFQKRTDDMRFFVKKTTISLPQPFLLPSDYRHTLLVRFYISNPGVCNFTGWKKASKTTSDFKGFSEDNYYWRDSLENPKFQIMDNFIYPEVGLDDVNSITQCYLEYVAENKLIYITDGSNYTSPNFSTNVDEQLIKIMVRMYFGDVQESKYNIALQEKQLKKD